ncbi:hypothetical protein AQUCO_06900005v1 [Aquilegia coerulea]|uniref:Uncharacterized protein n=1 Tax=Aquilegia coerulea TaxID=218851 RepID=A0A2G5CB00_AQUCA|nr:hypothetical protein AQUCO_06900005v1 [Aquilegia coerulea]
MYRNFITNLQYKPHNSHSTTHFFIASFSIISLIAETLPSTLNTTLFSLVIFNVTQSSFFTSSTSIFITNSTFFFAASAFCFTTNIPASVESISSTHLKPLQPNF